MLSETRNPLVPVYLNQRIVFDLLAMLQDGIATVTKISERTKSESARTNELDSSFGLNKAFSSLLAINLSGKVAKSSAEELGSTKDEERVHTPGSLFFKLRQLLEDRKLLKIDSPDFVPAPGDLMEFSGSLHRNPVIEAMNIMSSAMGMADALTDENRKQRDQRGNLQKNQMRQVKEQLAKVMEDLKSGGTTDLTAGFLQCGYTAIITAESASLNDPTMSDLVDGTFSVVGKVVRSVPKDEGAISLLRKSTMGRLAGEQLTEMMTHLDALRTQHGFDIPDMAWMIQGPVIQIIPVAIFA